MKGEGQSLRLKTFYLPQAERHRVLEDLAAQLAMYEEILFAYAYGSFLEDQRFRDLDAAVWVQREKLQGITFHYEDTLTIELARQLKLSFPLDLRIMNEAPVSFQYRVSQGRLLLDRDPNYRVEMISRAVARYLDMKPLLHHFLKEAYGLEA